MVGVRPGAGWGGRGLTHEGGSRCGGAAVTTTSSTSHNYNFDEVGGPGGTVSGGDGSALQHRDAATQPRLDCYSATIRRHHCQDREKILTTYLINDKNWRVLACLCPPYIQHRRGHQIFYIFVKFLHWSQYQVDTRTHYRVHVIASGYR